ncbi:MAG: hypothetical protein KatS3mg121_0650 [Gammaproteobacteria bacterium]|nr:MAG: hypothetical protein KatS3mg121_0650 [Gammaproteobacteria bacterium]
MNRTISLDLCRRGVLGIVLLAAGALAAADGLTVGAGLRTSVNFIEDGAPGGEDALNFDLDSVRLYTGGEVTEGVGFTFNTGYEAATNSIEALDVIARFEFTDAFNIWAGRFLPPSDRSNLSGPYFLGHWNFPAAQRYPAIFAGRDEGVAVWGQTGGGAFKYQVGLFEGPDALIPGGGDETLFAGRVVLNLLDPEPGYYNSSTYFGTKNVLAFGLAVQSFDGGTGANLDVLYETDLGGPVLTLEGAYYSYDEFAGTDGSGGFVLAGVLFDGWQPTVRLQTLDFTGDPAGEQTIGELSLNRILDGHDARLSLVLGAVDPEFGDARSFVNFGVQLQL